MDLEEIKKRHPNRTSLCDIREPASDYLQGLCDSRFHSDPYWTRKTPAFNIPLNGTSTKFKFLIAPLVVPGIPYITIA
jgi:hypothetical protein